MNTNSAKMSAKMSLVQIWLFLRNCSLFFFLNRFVLNEQASRPAPSSPQGGSAAAGAGQGLPQLPPGMSLYAVKRVIGETQWSPEQLEQVNFSPEL